MDESKARRKISGPVKVLAVVAQMNSGGLENRLMDILRNIDRKRVQIDIFTYRLEPGVYDEEAIALGSKIYYNKALTIKNMVQYVSYFRDFLLQHPEYQIVHAHQDAWCSVFCKGAFLARVPVRIAHSRTAISTVSFRNICKNIIKLPTKKYATHCFAVSKKAGVWLFGKKACEEGTVEVWENAIDCARYSYSEEVRQQVRRELGIAPDTLVLLHVGNFTLPKNHPFLLDVFCAYRKSDPKAILLLAGGDTPVEQNMDHMKQLAKQKGIYESVRFLGKRGDVSRLLQAGDIFVFPSLFEGFPGAVLEAQAAGLPCVISDRITEEVALLNTTRMLPLKRSIQQWVDTIREFQNIPRKDTFQTLFEKGYDIHALVEKMMSFYESEINKR